MILITILAIMAILSTLVVIVGASVGGTAMIIVFGDVIVCVGFIIWLIIRKFR